MLCDLLRTTSYSNIHRLTPYTDFCCSMSRLLWETFESKVWHQFEPIMYVSPHFLSAYMVVLGWDTWDRVHCWNDNTWPKPGINNILPIVVFATLVSTTNGDKCFVQTIITLALKLPWWDDLGVTLSRVKVPLRNAIEDPVILTLKQFPYETFYQRVFNRQFAIFQHVLTLKQLLGRFRLLSDDMMIGFL